MKTFKIHLVRHGLTDANLNGTYLGREDVPLNDKGIEELKYLKNKYEYPKVEAVFASPLQRCKQTAVMLFPDTPVIEIPDFTEYDFGEFEGHTAEELKDDENFKKWLGDNSNVAPPFGETNNHFVARVAVSFEKVVEGIIKTGTRETAVVAHGGVIMAILSFFGIPEAPMHEWMCNSGCGYTLLITPSIWMRGRKVEVFDTFPQSMSKIENLDSSEL